MRVAVVEQPERSTSRRRARACGVDVVRRGYRSNPNSRSAGSTVAAGGGAGDDRPSASASVSAPRARPPAASVSAARPPAAPQGRARRPGAPWRGAPCAAAAEPSGAIGRAAGRAARAASPGVRAAGRARRAPAWRAGPGSRPPRGRASAWAPPAPERRWAPPRGPPSSRGQATTRAATATAATARPTLPHRTRPRMPGLGAHPGRFAPTLLAWPAAWPPSSRSTT